jgi:hypothetical protein
MPDPWKTDPNKGETWPKADPNPHPYDDASEGGRVEPQPEPDPVPKPT